MHAFCIQGGRILLRGLLYDWGSCMRTVLYFQLFWIDAGIYVESSHIIIVKGTWLILARFASGVSECFTALTIGILDQKLTVFAALITKWPRPAKTVSPCESSCGPTFHAWALKILELLDLVILNCLRKQKITILQLSLTFDSLAAY